MDEKKRALNDEVARHFEKWSYPEAIQDLDDWGRAGYDLGEPERLHDLYWPHKEKSRDLDILIAGCGTNQAAIYAYKHPQARVVGIDVSTTSLKHEEYLKKKHDLSNLTLHHLPIEEAGSLGLDFDFIMSGGVVHCMTNPGLGVRNLGKLLRPDGTFFIMVYATYFRTGVYMMQEFFRELGLKQSPEDLELAKTTLEELTPYHFARQYTDAALDLSYNEGLIDTFLPARDRAYTVPECLDLVEKGELEFQGWVDNYCYYPEGRIALEHPLYPAINRLEDRKIWQVMELLWGSISTHSFLTCRKDRPKETYRIDFDSPQFLDSIPVRNHELRVTEEDESSKFPAAIRRLSIRPFMMNDLQSSVFGQVDGASSIRECMNRADLRGNPEVIDRTVSGFFRTLWRLGHIFLKTPK